MIRLEDECVDCPAEMGCMGKSCPNRNVQHLYCDSCGEEYKELYVLDGEELCSDCVLERLETVTL